MMALPNLDPPRQAVEEGPVGYNMLDRAAEWLCLAATPAFALMALVLYLGDGPGGMMCGPMGVSLFGGMGTMYLLMGLFHLAPWIKFAAAGRRFRRLAPR